MNVTVVKEFVFEAAHFLPGHPGLCKNLHGHSYKLQVGVCGPINDETGMVVDFKDLKILVEKTIIGKMDHAFLNEFEEDDFPCGQPTAERMLEWMLPQLSKYFPVKFLRLWETATSYAEVSA